MGCGASHAARVNDLERDTQESLVSGSKRASNAHDAVQPPAVASVAPPSQPKKPSLVERLMGKGGDTVVAAALKSKRNRGAVILGDPAQVQVGKQAYVKRVVPKTPEIRSTLLTAMRANVLFSALGHNEVEDIVDALEFRSVPAGTTVIAQGEPGDNFYVVETGRFDIIVNGKKVSDWGEGTKNRTFGELALLYNSPRAATVRTVTEARLWQIDRITFRNVVAQASFSQHEKLKAELKRGILEDLSDDQLDRIADAATVARFSTGDQIIRKGEEGEVFYIIETGAVICKNLSGDQSNNILHEGDYFGERALLKREPRAADVYAETDCSLIALHREDFENLLGHLRELLEHNLGVRLLLCVPMLASLSDSDRSTLFASLRVASYTAGQVILPEGAVPSSFFIVKEGVVQMVRSRPASASGASGSSGGSASASSVPAASSESSTLAKGEPKQQTDTHVVSTLLPGHWFPHTEPTQNGSTSAPPALAVSFVAKGSVQVFVTDRATYTAVLAPLVASRGSNHRSTRASADEPNSNSKRTSSSSSAAAAVATKHTAAGSQPSSADVNNNSSSNSSSASARAVASSSPSSTAATKSSAGASTSAPASSSAAAAAPSSSSVAPATAQGNTKSGASQAAAPAADSSNSSRTRQIDVIQARRLSSGLELPGKYSTAATSSRSPRKRLAIPFKELEQRATLGTGTFGRVKLVHHRKTNRTFALKMLQKSQIVALKQQTNIMNEREILWRVDHPFVIKLYDTYKDQNRLYMLLELVQGGELFSRLQNSSNPGRISPMEARFYGSCVLDAFDYIHSMSILYRDLKPENLLIDADGYLKLVDFGFAKVVADKTYTLCGTPEYLAPELVLGRGHDKGVDYWALGILLYEQVAGYSPFADHANNDQMVICRNILKGEFEFPSHMKDKDLRDLIQRLLVKDITRRIGCLRGGAADVKQHRFFRSLDFDALARRELAAPWKPTLKNPLDTSNFDEYDEDDRVDQYLNTDDSNWDKDF